MRPHPIPRSLACGFLACLLAIGPAWGAGGADASGLALADRLRMEAMAELAEASDGLVTAQAWQLDRARARLRLADRQAEALTEVALARRALAGGLVALEASARDDSRARLILAGLARAAAAAQARHARLGGEVAMLARQQRSAAADRAIWSTRRAQATAAAQLAGARWRTAMRARMAVLARSLPASSLADSAIRVADAVTLSAPAARLGRAMPPDHKRAIATDLRLDRRLLRLVAARWPARPPARRLDHAAPVHGPVWPIFGQLVAAGPTGLAIATSVDQVVSSPVSGTVTFAEPFRGIGPLLIIDRGRGYHVVLTGLARLDVRRGASVVAGQSLGEIVAGMDGPARLQLELRHRGLPIDPAPLLTDYHDKVRS